jgi:hypothetical protein
MLAAPYPRCAPLNDTPHRVDGGRPLVHQPQMIAPEM